MIKLLQSSWMSVIVGTVLYLGTTAALWRPPQINLPRHIEAIKEKAPKPSWEFTNPEVEELILDLKTQKAALALRERQLGELSKRLEAERQEISVVTQTVARLQREFDQNVVRLREEEIPNLKKLAKMYAAMAPESAVSILKELKDEEIVKIFAFMKDSETAPIMELLARQGQADAKRAAQISERLRMSISRPGNDKTKS